MNARKPLPIGPLAVVLRHLQPSNNRPIAILAVALAASLLVGIALLLR